jgi:hypothetical protein
MFTTPIADAQARLALGGYIYPQTDAVTTMVGLPSYVNDVGRTLWPNSTPQIVHFPADPVQILSYGRAVNVGAGNLIDAIQAATTESDKPVVVAGVSMGSIVINHALTRFEDDPNAPSPDQVSFAVFSDPQRGLLRLLPDGFMLPGYVNVPVPDSPYDVTSIYGEYDGWADPPDRPWNLLATVNAVMGGWFVHGTEIYANLDTVPEENISATTNSQGGTVTTYRVPTAQLPLTMPLRGFLPAAVVDRIDDLIRPVIDSAYVRHDGPGDRRQAPGAQGRCVG